MRIVAGDWGGRRLAAPRGHDTRPTSDRVREATFSSLTSMLGADLESRRVLDLFAGSGAMGLEALSRGAAEAVFVESGRAALAALRDNVATLGAAERARVVAADAFSSATKAQLNSTFGLLFADPPYRIDAARVGRLLEELSCNGAVANGAVVVYEHATGAPVLWPGGFSETRSRRYGSTEVGIAVYGGEIGHE